MPPAREVSFELERFEWLGDRLEVLGRWNGLRGSRARRPALTVEAGGRRHRLSGTLVSEDPWLAAFAWDGGEIAGAELELGRTLVVDLPPPRRRRRRHAAVGPDGDLRAQVEELRAMVADLRAERAASPTTEEAERLAEAAERHQREAAELREEVASLRSDPGATVDIDADALSRADAAEAARAAAEAELAVAREELAAARDELVVARDELAVARDEARASTEAAREMARAEIADALAAAPDPAELAAAVAARDAALADLETLRRRIADDAEGAELAGLRLAHGSLKAAHEQLEDEVDALRGVREERDALAAELEQVRSGAQEDERAQADTGDLIRQLQDRAAVAEGERERLEGELAGSLAEVERLTAEMARTRSEAERRIEHERATVTEVHGRLATAREETDRTIAAEAEETERLRSELAGVRDDTERQLAAERAEVARLREELITRAEYADAGEAGEASRRMLERVSRDLERERAKSKMLRRELEALRSASAQERRAVSSATANGTLTLEEPPVAATAAGRAGRGVSTAEGTRRRVGAARVGAAQRVPQSRPSTLSLWAVRVIAALVVAVMGIALVILVTSVT